MKIKILNCTVHLSYPLAAALTLVFIIDTSGMCLCCCLAAVCHELGHIIAMKLQNTSVSSVKFSLFDINIKDMQKGSRSFWGELFVIISGPLINFILGLVFLFIYKFAEIEYFKFFAYGNIALFTFNILPIDSLDGGNALMLILERNFSLKTADILLTIISFILLIPMAATGFLILLKSPYNFTLLFTSCYLMCIILFKRHKQY